MALDFGSFKKALHSLDNALKIYSSSSSRPPAELEVLRAGVIQNFEFSYELCWKYMKRWLELNVSPSIDGITRRELFRLAVENRLIEDVDAWMTYHQSRNQTAHTYDQATAEEVYSCVGAFSKDANGLLAMLESHND